MATYNGANHLAEQLESIVVQTLLPDELVVTDDNSSDGTCAILEEFARTAPFPVRIYRNPANIGYARNFERTAQLCEGELVFFCDQDDVWYPEKVAVMAVEFERDPELMVLVSDADLVRGDLSKTGRTQLQSFRRAGVPLSDFDIGCFSAHRKVWQAVALPMPEGFDHAHDQWINRFAMECGAARILDRRLLAYRRHPGNTMQWMVARAEGVSALNMLRAHGLKAGRWGWERKGALFRSMEERLRHCIEQGCDIPMSILERGIVRLRFRQKIMARRVDTNQLNRRKRWPRVLFNFVMGDYLHFTGWKSAVKDLIRPGAGGRS